MPRMLGSIFLLICALAGRQVPSVPRPGLQKTTPFPLVDWQPTQAPPDAEYVGSSTCATCHLAEAEHRRSTHMAQALHLAADSDILHAHPRIAFSLGQYSYEVVREGSNEVYSVSDGKRRISEVILWAFGEGRAGQTYVFRHDGVYYESRVSFFNRTLGLDITIGHSPDVPGSLEEALGNPLTFEGLVSCIGCHATGAVDSQLKLRLDRLIPGISCEGCHGPGARHVANVKAGNLTALQIFNPGRLRPGDLVNFCGSCHRTKLQVEHMNAKGIETIRFQPYGLVNSACYNPDDPRISCTACHDPHEDARTDPASYDSSCLACHKNSLPSPKRTLPSSHPKTSDAKESRSSLQSAIRDAPACPVNGRDCVTCHMPKHDVKGAHAVFTDHWIRTVLPPRGMRPVAP